MIRQFVILVLCGAGLLACSSANDIIVTPESVSITNDYAAINSVDSLLAPYKDSLDAEMQIVIASAEHNFEKGRPNGSLNNWAADVTLQSANSYSFDAPVFSLLNVGGLRNTISKGDVTVEDIFKVMPFDNEIVYVEMSRSSLKEIAAYLSKSGGEPLGGATLENGELRIEGMTESDSTFWIVTSDYLMNGGDRMDFFQDRIQEQYPGILLRDAMLEEARNQKVLIYNSEDRIQR